MRTGFRKRAYCSASAAERRGRANARQLVQPIHLDFEKPDASKILNKMALRRIRTPYLPHRGKHSNHYASLASQTVRV